VLQRDFLVASRSGEEYVAPDIYRAFNALRDNALSLGEAERSLQHAMSRAEGMDIGSVEMEVDVILREAGSLVTSAFLEITGSGEFLDQVLLGSAFDSAELTVRLLLSDGREVAPAEALSEASLDLLALMLFCAVVEACAQHGQARFLVLDDVFQSVDSTFRERACRYLAARFSDWQLVITTHDRLWFAVLSDTFQRAAVPFVSREIVRWSMAEGPTIRSASARPDRALRHAMNSSEPAQICSAAGLLLEEIADRLSVTLGSSVVRRPGDRYTLGDLWPGVRKRLSKTTLADSSEAVSNSLVLRNLVGAHFNAWAQSVSHSEARQFGKSVLDLLDQVRHQACAGWIERAPGGRYQCRCGDLTIGPRRA
jgi:hypothetical protein